MAYPQDPNQPDGQPPPQPPGWPQAQQPYPAGNPYQPSDQPPFQQGQQPYQGPYQGPYQQQGYQQPYPPQYQGTYQGQPQPQPQPQPPYYGAPLPPPGKTSRTPIMILVAVLVVCLGIGGYFALSGGAAKPGPATGSGTPPGVGGGGGVPGSGGAQTPNSGAVIPPAGAVGPGRLAIPFGTDPSAKVVLTIYEDVRCPPCASTELANAPIYEPLADSGKIQVQFHLVNLVDRDSPGTSGSLDAGNAIACAQDAGKFLPYHSLLFADQPAEGTDLYGSAAELITLAKQIPGLDSPAFEACVTSGKHDGWVAQNYTSLLSTLGQNAYTPYYAINGRAFGDSTISPSNLQAALQAAINGS